MGLTRLEQETIILFNEEESIADVYTYNGALIRKLDKLCEEYPEQLKFVKEEHGGRSYIVPKKRIRIGTPGKTPANAFPAQNTRETPQV